MEKWLPYTDSVEEEDKTGGKIVPIRQETQAEETFERGNRHAAKMSKRRASQ